MKKKILSVILCIIVLLLIGVTSAYAVNTSNNTNYISNEQNIVSNSNTVTTTTTADNEKQGENESSEENKEGLSNHDIGLLAAALATGLACIGAGIAVAMVASSAIGAISENPSLLGKTIIFAGLAEGIAIYGLIISIMILNKV